MNLANLNGSILYTKRWAKIFICLYYIYIYKYNFIHIYVSVSKYVHTSVSIIETKILQRNVS